MSTNFLNKAAALVLAAFLCLSGCAGREKPAVGKPLAGRGMRIAVLPVNNLSGGPGPLKDIRQSFEKALKDQGQDVVDDGVLEEFMARHRIRHTGGITREDSMAIKDELGVEGVLITSLELYSEASPPKIALNVRLDSTGETPAILWIDGLGLAGDDSPGLFDLGLIEDPKELTEKAVGDLMGSLAANLSGGTAPLKCKYWKKYSPRISYRSPMLNPEKKYSVAVMPFLNSSERKNAPEILALEFVRQMRQTGNFAVVEPGLVREELLRYRIILEGGVSLDNAGVIFETLDVDLVLAGNVLDCEDYQGPLGTPKVSFSAILIERQSREAVWESRSYNEGDEFVWFFDRGRINTAEAMSCRMVKNIVNMMFER